MLKNKLQFGQYDWAVFLSLFFHAFAFLLLPIILLPVSLELGFSLADYGKVQMYNGMMSIIAIIASGFIANKIGIKRTFILSLVVVLVGLVLLSFAESYFFYVCAIMIASAAGSIVTCLSPSIMHDLHSNESGKYISLANSCWSTGVLITVLLTGYLLSAGWSWRIILLFASSAIIIPVIIVIIPNCRNNVFSVRSEVLSIGAVIQKKIKIIKNNMFWKFVVLNGLVSGAEMSLQTWTASYVQVNLGGSVKAGGIAAACFSVGMIISRFCSGYIAKQNKIKSFLMGVACYAALVTFILPFAGSLTFFYVIFFMCGIGAAPFCPYVQSYLIEQLRGEDKTVLLMLLSVSGFIGYSFFSWFAGFLISYYGDLHIVYYIAPINYLLFLIIIAVVNSDMNIFSRRKKKLAL